MMGAPSGCREVALLQATSNVLVSCKFFGFYPFLALFFALLDVVAVPLTDWLSLMQCILSQFLTIRFFSEKGQQHLYPSHAIAAGLRTQCLKVKVSFNLLQVLAFRNNFPGWDCLLFSGASAQGEVEENSTSILD